MKKGIFTTDCREGTDKIRGSGDQGIRGSGDRGIVGSGIVGSGIGDRGWLVGLRLSSLCSLRSLWFKSFLTAESAEIAKDGMKKGIFTTDCREGSEWRGLGVVGFAVEEEE